MAIDVLAELDEARIGHVGPVLVVVFRSKIVARTLDVLEQHQASLAARYGKVTLISVVDGANQQPDPEVSARIKSQAPTLAKLRRGNIVVIAKPGLGAVMARTFIAMLSLVTPEPLIAVKSLQLAAEKARALPGQPPEVVQNAALGAELEAFAAESVSAQRAAAGA